MPAATVRLTLRLSRAALNGQAFLDTESIDDGDDFPQRLLDALLASRIVVIFASKSYLERRYCRVEMRLALHAGNENASHIVLALGDDARAVREALPEQVAGLNWPPATETGRRCSRQTRGCLNTRTR